jgi:hypothetical protein
MRQPVRHPRLGSLNFILTQSWSRSSTTIHSTGHLTSGVWFADGWNAFPARYPSFKEKGAVFWAGNIRSALPEPNCDLEKSGPVARGRLKESRPRTSYGGPLGSLNAACALGPWDPLRHRQRHDVVDRHTQRRGSRDM